MKTSLKVINVVGARPNFMKIAPIMEAMARRRDRIEAMLVHTGQHYDERMSQAFFSDLGLPRPDIDLGVGSGSHAEQTARVMLAFEQTCLQHAPDLVLVVGDVNSTLACALTAKKLGIAVAHVEAGLRSRDRDMPEELNRLCTDALADILFTTDRGADANLRDEGIDATRIVFVGNVMIDTLLRHRALAAERHCLEALGLQSGDYAVLTLHRPSNVDDPAVLDGILGAMAEIARERRVVFPVHPRTRARIEAAGLSHRLDAETGIVACEPLGYLDFLCLVMSSSMVFTDSGGLQEETTVLGIPCVTLRFNTERPITCEQGTNVLAGNRPADILAAARRAANTADVQVPERWDGQAGERIVHWLCQHLAGVDLGSNPPG